MPYLYVTAGIFPRDNITFTVVAVTLLEPVISFTFVSNQNLFFSTSSYERQSDAARFTDRRLHINYMLQIHSVEDILQDCLLFPS